MLLILILAYFKGILTEIEIKKLYQSVTTVFLYAYYNITTSSIETVSTKKKCTQKFELKHGTKIRSGITCKKIPIKKSIEFDMALK